MHLLGYATSRFFPFATINLLTITFPSSGVPPKPYNRKMAREVKALEDRVLALEKLVSAPAVAVVRGMKADDAAAGTDHIPGVTDIAGGTAAATGPTGRRRKTDKNAAGGDDDKSGKLRPENMGMMPDVPLRDPSPFFLPSGSHPAATSPGASSFGSTLRELLEADGFADADPESLAHNFFELEMAHFPLNMVHRRTFMVYPDRILPILRYSVLGCGARLAPSCERDSPMLTRSDALFQKARGYIAYFIDEPHIQAIQALLIMVMCSAATNRNSAASMYLSMLARMALILKLDTDPDHIVLSSTQRPLTWIEKETMRRTWWACFILDRMIAGITQRAPLLAECREDSVRWPSADAVWESMDPIESIPPQIILAASSKESLLRYFWGIIAVFYRVVAFSRGPGSMSGGGQKRTPEEVRESLETFARLEEDISRWFYSLPEPLRNRLLLIDETTRFSNKFGCDEELPWIAVVIQMTYYGCLCILHRPRLILGLSAQGLAADYHFDEPHNNGNGVPSSSESSSPPSSREASKSASPKLPHMTSTPSSTSDISTDKLPDDASGSAAKLRTAMTSVVATTAHLSILDLGKHVLGKAVITAARSGRYAGAEAGPDGVVHPVPRPLPPQGAVEEKVEPPPTPAVSSMGTPNMGGGGGGVVAPGGGGPGTPGGPMTAPSTPGSVSSASSPAAGTGLTLSSIPADQIAFSLQQGQAAATAIARLVLCIRVTNPGFLNMSSYAGLSIIESTLILMLLVTRGVEAGTVEDLENAIRCRTLIGSNMACLNQLARTFFMFKHSLAGIESMVSSTPDVDALAEMIDRAASAGGSQMDLGSSAADLSDLALDGAMDTAAAMARGGSTASLAGAGMLLDQEVAAVAASGGFGTVLQANGTTPFGVAGFALPGPRLQNAMMARAAAATSQMPPLQQPTSSGFAVDAERGTPGGGGGAAVGGLDNDSLQMIEAIMASNPIGWGPGTSQPAMPFAGPNGGVGSGADPLSPAQVVANGQGRTGSMSLQSPGTAARVRASSAGIARTASNGAGYGDGARIALPSGGVGGAAVASPAPSSVSHSGTSATSLSESPSPHPAFLHAGGLAANGRPPQQQQPPPQQQQQMGRIGAGEMGPVSSDLEYINLLIAATQSPAMGGPGGAGPDRLPGDAGLIPMGADGSRGAPVSVPSNAATVFQQQQAAAAFAAASAVAAKQQQQQQQFRPPHLMQPQLQRMGSDSGDMYAQQAQARNFQNAAAAYAHHNPAFNPAEQQQHQGYHHPHPHHPHAQAQAHAQAAFAGLDSNLSPSSVTAPPRAAAPMTAGAGMGFVHHHHNQQHPGGPGVPNHHQYQQQPPPPQFQGGFAPPMMNGMAPGAFPPEMAVGMGFGFGMPGGPGVVAGAPAHAAQAGHGGHYGQGPASGTR
ncbi:hypothetical protein HDU96_010028 [Phlyctochytrium bullatum]|nr:hypothetical protein HDU96_010028 [Phlyctochytrium bullatum]